MTDPLSSLTTRHGFSPAAIEAAMSAIRRGNGITAQFSHPEFGGMGQWMPGQIMIGDMFNSGLRNRVDALFNDLAELHQNDPAPGVENDAASVRAWYPSEFGTPSSVGAQNDVRYAYYPESRRLVVEQSGMRSVYDTADHHITGVSQQQSRATGDVVFTSQHGTVGLDTLRRVDTH